MKNNFHIFLISFLLSSVIISACSDNKKQPPLFSLLTSKKTGIDFSNKLTATNDFNLFKYMYFYNGAGVGSGDFNNDGKIDLFFASNQSQNRLYLNEGDLHFKDITHEAGIPSDGGWSTGVSVVDINNDGLLDIYVCRVGQYEILKSKNQLLVCTGIKNGIPQYIDSASSYGLDFSGFSTQAAFLDYDMDGDLDMFLMNHSVHHNGTFGERKLFIGTYHPLSGDRLYRNDMGHFTDVTKSSGINSSAIGYGLGIAVSDINLDGYPDIYIGNDFHENDYLYINQRNGTFKDELAEKIMHTSQFSMGVDVADINNDALPEIISMDMLPSDPYILKRSLGEDEYNLFYSKIGYGYSYQYTRNNLQLNRGNGLFSEVGMYSEVYATDWSWSALWVDFDNDGWKDLFVSNGIPKRMNDMDYVNYISNDEVQEQIHSGNLGEKELSLSKLFPEIKLSNKFFRNKQSLQFEDGKSLIENDQPTYSNGAVYADLDNDGDLDIVVSNIDDPAMVYRNNSSENSHQPYLKVHLKGPEKNVNAIGATVIVFGKDAQLQTYEKYPVHGFQSSMEIPLQIGLGQNTPDSILLVWPDRRSQKINFSGKSQDTTLLYSANLPLFNKAAIIKDANTGLEKVQDITANSGIKYLHEEDKFGEFDREQLIPHKLSTEGPALAIGDINGDQLPDFFIGASRYKTGAVYIQNSNGTFHVLPQPALSVDSMYEDVDACWVDVNNDHFPDLIVASGGNEFYGNSPMQQSRVYLNDGKGILKRLPGALDNFLLTASAITSCDINNDGFADLFLGARCKVYDYGKVPQSYLLLNDGTGKFRDATKQFAPELSTAGFVKQAQWIDLDKDGDQDLLLALEWGPVTLYENQKGKLIPKILNDKKGWWNFLKAVDLDGDGDLDLVAGNQGKNMRLQPTAKEPVKLYYNDFDGNGKSEQVLTYFIEGMERPFANKMELERQIPLLKKKFLYADNFAKANLQELFSAEKLTSSTVLEADYFSNSILINEGNGKFNMMELPWQAQLSQLMDAVPVDYNKDGLTDLLLFGNYYDNNIQLGRNDADFGSLLINKGKNQFEYHTLPGLAIKGQVRHAQLLNISANHLPSILLAKNNDSLQLISLPGNKPSGQ
jgi:hypothetical protein